MPDYGHVGRPSTYLAVARDFDQIARLFIRESHRCQFRGSRFQQAQIVA